MKMRRPLAPKSISCATQFRSTFSSAAGQTTRRYALLGAAGAALLLGACVSDVDPAAAGAGAGSAGMGSTVVGNGGSAGGGTVSNSAGSGGSGANQYTSDPTFATGARCPAVTQALLTDFSYASAPIADAGADAGGDAGTVAAAPPNMTGVSFGDFTNTLSGSSFVYPGDGAYAVHSDVTGSNWHMTGSIGNYSGFGVVFVGCAFVDASMYQGISFTVQGSVPMGNNSLTFSVGTAADDISHVWLNAVAMPSPAAATNAGRCIPAASQYDGTCAAPSHLVPVTAERTTVRVLWADLASGRPSASVDPKEITSLSWAFPAPAGAGTPNPITYNVDITVDDLQFIVP